MPRLRPVHVTCATGGRNDVEWRVRKLFALPEAGEFANGECMAHGNRVLANERSTGRFTYRTFGVGEYSAERVRAIEHDKARVDVDEVFTRRHQAFAVQRNRPQSGLGVEQRDRLLRAAKGSRTVDRRRIPRSESHRRC